MEHTFIGITAATAKLNKRNCKSFNWLQNLITSPHSAADSCDVLQAKVQIKVLNKLLLRAVNF